MCADPSRCLLHFRFAKLHCFAGRVRTFFGEKIYCFCEKDTRCFIRMARAVFAGRIRVVLRKASALFYEREDSLAYCIFSIKVVPFFLPDLAEKTEN